MLRAWEDVAPAEPHRRKGSPGGSPSQFLNRENTKKLEFHEIFESRISWFLFDSIEKSFYGAIPCANCIFIFFSCFSFSFRVFAIQNDDHNKTLLLFIARNMS